MSTCLISCLCVTFNRPHLLHRSITCFLNQSYSNKELIILYSSKDSATATLLRNISNFAIKVYPIENYEAMSLGTIRNKAVSLANGEYVCNWDDDDWYHPKRLELQLSRTKESNKAGSILMSVVMYDAVRQKSYFYPGRPWEFSLFCEKQLFSTYRFRYANKSRGEDTPLVTQLIAHNKLVPVVAPPVYIYMFHGGNTCGYEHFKYFFDLSQELTDSVNKKIQHILEQDQSTVIEFNLYTDSEILESLDHYYYLRADENFPKTHKSEEISETDRGFDQ